MKSTPQPKRWTRRHLFVALALVSVFGMLDATPASAVTEPQNRSLGVSVPPEPTPVEPGAVADIQIRVINANDAPVTVTVTGRQVELGDDGGVEVRDGADPLWQNQATFPAEPQTVAPQNFINVTVQVRAPVLLAPDLYFIGFVVTPVVTPGDVTLINQIGSFVTIDIPGARERILEADLKVPSVRLGSNVEGSLKVLNVGPAAVRFFGENNTTSSPGSITPIQQRFEKSLVPVGKFRTITVTGKPSWPIGFVHMAIRVVYPGATDAATKEIVINKRILVINPTVLVLAALIVAALGAWIFFRKRGRPHRSNTARDVRPKGQLPKKQSRHQPGAHAARQ